jgi:hypothetical protein
LLNESTLLPLLVRLLPRGRYWGWLLAAIAELLAGHHLPRELIDRQVAERAGISGGTDR